MADGKVRMTELPPATEIRDEAIILINQGGVDYKAPATMILRADKNLEEVDPQTSRANINVYSTEEVDEISKNSLSAVARKFSVKTSEVVVANAGASLLGFKVIYDEDTQLSFALPSYLLPGDNLISLVNGILKTNSGTYDLGAIAVSRSELVKIIDSFPDGFTLRNKNEVVILDSTEYRWGGDLPKEVPPNSTINSTGGISPDKWIKVLGPDLLPVSLVDFGADPSGALDSTDAINKCFKFATDNGLPVVQNSGVFKISGTVVFSTPNVDMTGSTLLMHQDGYFIYSQKDKPVTYDSSNEEESGVLAGFNSSSSLSRAIGSSQLSGIVNNSLLVDKFVIYKDPSQKMFQYRPGSPIETRKDFNRVLNDGYLENPHYYALGVGVESVYALPINGFVSTLRGFSFDMSQSTKYHIFVADSCSRLVLSAWSFKGKIQSGTGSFYALMELSNIYDLRIEDLDDPYTYKTLSGGTVLSSYTLSLNHCLNVVIENMKADGSGWGSTGNNDCANVTFINCKLSRIDFHKPFRNKLSIIGCKLGTHGISATAMGDLVVRDTEFVYSTNLVGLGSVLSTRSDAGGFMDGDITFENCTASGKFSGVVNKPMIQGATDSIEQGPLTGSPVRRVLGRRVTIRNHKGLSMAADAQFSGLIGINMAGALEFPDELIIENYKANTADSTGVGLNISTYLFMPKAGKTFDNALSALAAPVTSNIRLINVDTPVLRIFGSFASSEVLHNLSVVIDGLHNSNAGGAKTELRLQQRGRYCLRDSDVGKISTSYGASDSTKVNLSVFGGSISQVSGSPLAWNNSADVSLNGVSVIFDQSSSIALSLLSKAKISGCRYFNMEGVPVASVPVYTNPGSLSVNPNISMVPGNRVSLFFGYTSNGTYTSMEVLGVPGKVMQPVSTSGVGASESTSFASASLSLSGRNIVINGVTSVSGYEFVGASIV